MERKERSTTVMQTKTYRRKVARLKSKIYRHQRVAQEIDRDLTILYFSAPLRELTYDDLLKECAPLDKRLYAHLRVVRTLVDRMTQQNGLTHILEDIVRFELAAVRWIDLYLLASVWDNERPAPPCLS